MDHSDYSKNLSDKFVFLNQLDKIEVERKAIVAKDY